MTHFTRADISPVIVRELVDYRHDNGRLYWRERSLAWFDAKDREHRAAAWNARFAGLEAFNCPDGRGYLTGRLFRILFFAHRIAFAHYHGTFPIFIDHRDGDGTNNRIANLRSCNRAENNRNTGSHAGASSKFKGVSWDAANQKWRAKILIDGKQVCLGRHANEREAALAYDAAARNTHGAYAKCNFPLEVEV